MSGESGRRSIAAAVVFLATLVTCSAAHASDAVLEWNQIALAATVTAGQGPLPQIRSMAIVQVSMHDAVNAITRDYTTYLHRCRAPWGASPDAAAIGAAHRALTSLFPTQAAALDAARASSLASHAVSSDDPGIAFGEAVATAVLALRSTDGVAQAQFPYTAPHAGDPGVWVAIGGAPALLPGWGNVVPWVIEKARRFRPEGPRPLSSRRYARDYNEIKEIGSLTSASRTAEQTEIARFWLAAPSVIWNGVATQIIEARGLDISTSARVMALLYLAAADASIVCWDAKYTYNFWRPIFAIQQGNSDGNRHTLGDPTWQPLIPTPPFPEYTSGHTTNSSAMATVLRLLFGDDPGISIVASSPTNSGFERHWESLSEGVDEVIDARVFSGIHFRTSDEIGARVGRIVARFVMCHALRPRHEHD
jgi:hypothetical protein